MQLQKKKKKNVNQNPEKKSHNCCRFSGELSEGADSPEASENKSNTADGEISLWLQLLSSPPKKKQKTTWSWSGSGVEGKTGGWVDSMSHLIIIGGDIPF